MVNQLKQIFLSSDSHVSAFAFPFFLVYYIKWTVLIRYYQVYVNSKKIAAKINSVIFEDTTLRNNVYLNVYTHTHKPRVYDTSIIIEKRG